MRRRKGPISAAEKARRARQRAASLAAVERLLFSRKQTAHALGGVSIATVMRLEKAGKLDKIRPAGVPNGAVFHRAEQVRALAAGGKNGAASPACEAAGDSNVEAAQ